MKQSAQEEEEDPMAEGLEDLSVLTGGGRREMVNTQEEASALEAHL